MTVLSARAVRSCLVYNPDTGSFIRKKNNKLAGGINSDGYHQIGINGKTYYAHRLAWLIMTGEWPEFEVDHRDTDRSNNKWGNLRQSTHAQNLCNRPAQKNNTSGCKNISWGKTMNKWLFRARHAGKDTIVYFNSKQEAIEAAPELRKKMHGEFERAV